MAKTRRRSRALSGSWWACLLAGLFVGTTAQLASAEGYLPYTPIGQVSISGIDPGECWLAGSDHTVECTEAGDTDCNSFTGQPEGDSVTCYWGGSGSFWGNQYIGTCVVYICSDGAGEDSIYVTADDNYYAKDYYGEGQDYVDNALADESATYDMKTVYVTVPWVEEIDFAGATNYPMKDDQDDPVLIEVEYDASEDNNEPACQQMDETVTLQGVKFRAPMDLTRSSLVNVKAEGTVTFPATDDGWGAWDSSGITMTSTDKIVAHVHKYDNNFTLTWSYRCPTGSNNWITCGSPNPTNHTVYVVRAQPFRDMATPWQKVLDYSCVWAEGQTTAPGTFAAIWDKINDLNATDMKYWGATPPPGGGQTTRDLLKHKDGRCGAWAHFFDDLCACQRITAAAKGIRLKATSPYPPHGYSALIVYNMNVGPMHFPPPFRYRFSQVDLTPQGIPGQGMATPMAKCFDDHGVNEYDGKLYDPSYGKGPYNDLHAWEEEAIKAYVSDQFCPPPPNGDRYVKMNGFNETEVEWK